MSGYYDRYDTFGEPHSILPMREPEGLSDNAVRDQLGASLRHMDDADLLYETLRHRGATHEQARAAVGERFRL